VTGETRDNLVLCHMMAEGFGEGQKNHESNQVNHAVQTLAKLSDPEFVASMPGGEKSAAIVRERIQSTVDTYNGEQSELFNTQVTAQIDARSTAKEAEALAKEEEAEQKLQELFNKPGSTSKSLAVLAGTLGQPEIAKPWIALAEKREKTQGKSPAQAVPFNLELTENSWKDLQALRPTGKQPEEWYAELQSNLEILRTEAKEGGGVAGPAALNARLNSLSTRMLNEISTLKGQDRQDERALSRARIDDLEEIEKHSPTKNDKQLLAHRSSLANTSLFGGGHAIDPLEFGPLSRDVLRVERGFEPETFVIDKEGNPVFNSDGTPKYLDNKAQKLTSQDVEQDVYGNTRQSRFPSQPTSAASTATPPPVDTEAVAKRVNEAVPQRDKIPMPRSISSDPELLAQFPDWDSLPVERQLFFQKKYDALLRAK